MEVGAGGTAAKLAASGAQVTFVVCTDGGAGAMTSSTDIAALVATRKREAIAAAKLIGAQDVVFLDFPDGGDYSAWELAKRLAERFARISPDIVFAPDPRLPSEIHPDHIKCGEAVNTALVMSGFPLVMKRNGIPFDETIPLEPRKTLCFYYAHRTNRIVGLSKAEFALKLQSVACHESQFPAGATDETRLLKAYLTLRGRRFGWRVLRRFGRRFLRLRAAPSARLSGDPAVLKTPIPQGTFS
ncbi:MAG: PIG-L family deacetylase [Bacillus subtilis]|nr:PIG-L family deacetylase [Bacillus subtilis]